MGSPVIGYDNIFRRGADSSPFTPGLEPANAYSGTTYDFWSPLAVTGTQYLTTDMGISTPVSYFAYSRLTWDVAITYLVRAEYSSDNFVADINSATSDVSVTNLDPPHFEVFTEISARYWRIRVEPVGVPTVRLKVPNVSLGVHFDLLRAYSSGMSIPTDSIMDKITNNMSDGGEFIGRSVINRSVSSNISVTFRDLTFHRGVWRSFIDSALEFPFWFSWNADFHEDVIYAWLVGNPQPPTWDTNRTLRAGITIAGFRT